MLCDIIWMTLHFKFIDINAAHVISMLKTLGEGWIQYNTWDTLKYGSTMMEILSHFSQAVEFRRMLYFQICITSEIPTHLKMKWLPKHISYT